MALPNKSFVLFNAAGVGLFMFLGAYMLKPVFFTDETEACSARYPAGHRFALENPAGNALTPIELQGRAGFREYGILANASVQPTANTQWGNSLSVKMASVRTSAEPRNGAGYVWAVSAMNGAQSACLTYNVFLSKDVDLKSPARLPGLLAEAPGKRDGGDGFAARIGWQKPASVDVSLDFSARDRTADVLMSNHDAEWQRGRWVRVEQEVTLNAPGRNTGSVRVWIDDKLAVERSNLNLRFDPAVRFVGVAGDTGYVRGGRVAEIKASPFVVQWR